MALYSGVLVSSTSLTPSVSSIYATEDKKEQLWTEMNFRLERCLKNCLSAPQQPTIGSEASNSMETRALVRLLFMHSKRGVLPVELLSQVCVYRLCQIELPKLITNFNTSHRRTHTLQMEYDKSGACTTPQANSAHSRVTPLQVAELVRLLAKAARSSASLELDTTIPLSTSLLQLLTHTAEYDILTHTHTHAIKAIRRSHQQAELPHNL